MPRSALGSYELLGLRNDVCFDRFARYGPYGLGYNNCIGGVGFEGETESAGNEVVWEETGKIDYRNVDWTESQQRCFEANRYRFQNSSDMPEEKDPPITRTAVVIRSYENFKWTPMALLSIRAMITELSLKSGAEYTVHLLMQVRDKTFVDWDNQDLKKEYLDRHVPEELQGLVTFWSEPQMRLAYPDGFPQSYKNPGHKKDIYGVFRSPHFPLQIFAKQHPEYDFFWNWELDVRVIGSYYELLDRIGKWADSRPRKLLWEHNERYFIPDYHKSWDKFTKTILESVSLNETIIGPIQAPWRKLLAKEENGGSVVPESCLPGNDSCGVGEGADLITLHPVFNSHNSSWFFYQDVTGYDDAMPDALPRRSSVITVGRLSRRLLLAMHEEVSRHRHTMFAEMFPTSVALHHGFKAVYAPHPVYMDRAWQPPSEVDRFFNSGERHSTSGRGGPFTLSSEKVHLITSWYYRSGFTEELWRRWLGYRGRSGGGLEEESREEGSGRLCLRSMILHPIKHEHPNE